MINFSNDEDEALILKRRSVEANDLDEMVNQNQNLKNRIEELESRIKNLESEQFTNYPKVNHLPNNDIKRN